jgi:hypothetical protein
MRYDLLDVYAGDKLWTKNESAAVQGIALRVQIANVLDDILAESRSRSAGAAEQVIDAFDGESEHECEARDVINSMSLRWPLCARAIWDAIGYDPSGRAWVKDRKARLTDDEMKQLGAALKQVDHMNGVFLRLGTVLLAEKVARAFPDERYNVAEYAGYTKRPSRSDVSSIVAKDEYSVTTRDLGAGSDLGPENRP